MMHAPPNATQTWDGGYIVEFDTMEVEEIVSELAVAAQTIEDIAKDYDNELWVEAAVESVMMDTQFPAVSEAAMAVELKYGERISNLFNNLTSMEAAIINA